MNIPISPPAALLRAPACRTSKTDPTVDVGIIPDDLNHEVDNGLDHVQAFGRVSFTQEIDPDGLLVASCLNESPVFDLCDSALSEALQKGQ